MTNTNNEKSKFELFNENSPEGEALRNSYKGRFEALKTEITDEILAQRIEEAYIKENGNSIPEGFSIKDKKLVKNHISDKEWIEQYEKNVAKESRENISLLDKLKTNTLEQINKIRDLCINTSHDKEKSNKPK